MPNNHEWPTVTFGDVVQEITVHEREPESQGLERYVGLDHLDPGDPRVRRWGLISEGVTFTKVFRAGQILFGKRRVYQKKMGVPDFDGICSGDIIVLDTKDQRLSREFLALVVQTEAFFAHAEKTSSGSLSPRTKFRELAKFDFLLPPPQQQRELVELMQGFERAIEAGEEVCNAALVFFGALGKSSFPTVKAKHEVEKSEIYNENFSPLSSFADILVGQSFKSADFEDSGEVRLLRGQNVGYSNLDWESTKYYSGDISKLGKYFLSRGDVIIGMNRFATGNGYRIAKMDSGSLPVLLVQRVARLRAKEERHIEFLWQLANSESFKDYLNRNQRGIDMPCVSKENLVDAYIELPHEGVWESVAEKLRYSENYYHSSVQALERLLVLRFSILNSALSPLAVAEAAAEVPA